MILSTATFAARSSRSASGVDDQVNFGLDSVLVERRESTRPSSTSRSRAGRLRLLPGGLAA